MSLYSRFCEGFQSSDLETRRCTLIEFMQSHTDYLYERLSQHQIITTGLVDACIVDDVLQETWMVATREISRFVWYSEAHTIRWLYVIALNLLHKQVHSLRPKQNISLEEMDLEDRGFASALLFKNKAFVPNPEDVWIGSEEVQAVVHAFEALRIREIDQEIFLAYALHLASTKALAFKYHLSTNHIRQIVHRVRKKLYGYLGSGEMSSAW